MSRLVGWAEGRGVEFPPFVAPAPAQTGGASLVLSRLVGWAEGKGVELPPFVAEWAGCAYA